MLNEVALANRAQLRSLVRGAYDLQKLRMMMGSRLFANLRAKLGLEAQEKQEGEDEETGEEKDAGKLLKLIKENYRLLTEGIARNRTLPTLEGFKGNEIISTYAELVLVHNFLGLLSREESMFRDLEKVLVLFPVYNTWLKQVTGVGPTMAGVILSEFRIERSDTVSKMWAYCGLDVAPDGRGRSRRLEHLVKRSYTNKEGEEAQRNSITFNPFLKTKMVGVLSTSFLRSGSPYVKVYRDYKLRLTHREAGNTEWSKSRIHRASLRYMVKMFLLDLYVEWRTVENLPVRPSYHEEKLGHKHVA